MSREWLTPIFHRRAEQLDIKAYARTFDLVLAFADDQDVGKMCVCVCNVIINYRFDHWRKSSVRVGNCSSSLDMISLVLHHSPFVQVIRFRSRFAQLSISFRSRIRVRKKSTSATNTTCSRPSRRSLPSRMLLHAHGTHDITQLRLE